MRPCPMAGRIAERASARDVPPGPFSDARGTGNGPGSNAARGASTASMASPRSVTRAMPDVRSERHAAGLEPQQSIALLRGFPHHRVVEAVRVVDH